MQASTNHYYVYIVGGTPDNTLQIGTAGNLRKQLQKANLKTEADPQKLVYYEHYDREAIALAREKQIKNNSPQDNRQLVESMNPNWLDLSDLL
jgi:putative endonuclease